MRPDERDLDAELRGHLAIGVQERIDRGEDPAAARRAALAELGSLMAARDSMRAVWRHGWADAIGSLGQDLRVTLRSLMRARSLTATVVMTLALGIGANAAIFSVVREVLLRPLVNRDADRLVYIRQSAAGLGAANTTFSVPEIGDLRSRITTIGAFGAFSTIDFTMIGLGEPRVVQAGVVGGSYFDVMGLRPVLGRLLDAGDDGPDAAGAVVLTHRFWSGALTGDPTVIGRTIRLGTRAATVVGVLEPSVPYPVDTEIIANVVTSPHHLEATMVTLRTHRMTELFGRLAPGATLGAAKTELAGVHAAMMREHPEAYPGSAGIQLTATPLRDQIVAPARKILLVLLAAAGLVFVIACSNVANLMLARAVRREGELAIRAALGAGTGALRRALLVETLVLCGAGAGIGVLLARPLVSVVGRYAGRFSVRALDVSVDSSLLWVSGGLAMAAAVVLAFVPRLPSSRAPAGFTLAGGGVRITPGTSRRLRVFAATQIALSFVLLTGAGSLIAALVALQRANISDDLRQTLVLDVPMPLDTAATRVIDFFQSVTRRVRALPGVQQVAVGNFAPWRDAGILLPAFPFSGDGRGTAEGEEPPHARLRAVSPGFFAALGVPILAGRDFTDEDRRGQELTVILSQSAARRLFPEGHAVNRRFWWTDPLFGKREPRRIVGVVEDVDDENLVPGPALTVYHPLQQVAAGSRLFVLADGDPYALVPAVIRIVREIAPEQPVERAATLADVRTEVLGPERLNAFVLSVFAGISLLVAVVGVAGVLAFSVSARTHEFGVRLAIGSSRWRLMRGILSEGTFIAAIGIAAGAAGGYGLGRAAVSSLDTMRVPVAIPVLGAASVLVAAVAVAALMPAARASRVDVILALRAE